MEPSAENREPRHERERQEPRSEREPRPERPRKRLGLPHLLASGGAFLTTLVAGGVKGVTAVQGTVEALSIKIDAHDKEISTRFEGQSKALAELQLTLAKIEAHGDSADKTADRLALEHGRAVDELRGLEKAVERVIARIDDHDRRLATFEQGQGRK